MAEFVLHCMAQSGHSYKVALMLELCGADWEASWVDFFNGETRSDEFRSSLNEMGEVPVLVHGNETLTQSAVIMDYLVAKFGKFGLGHRRKNAAKSCAGPFSTIRKSPGMIGPLRFMRTLITTGETDVVKFLDGRAKSALAILDKHLAKNDFAIGSKLTTADFSLCSYLFYEGELGIDLNEYQNVTAWLGRVKSLPGWKHPYDLMPGHPLPSAA